MRCWIAVAVLSIEMITGPVFAQSTQTTEAASVAPGRDASVPPQTGSTNGSINPLTILKNAAGALIPDSGRPREEAGESYTSSMSILILLTILSIAPALLVMCTSFTRIVIVLALLRQAIGTQSLPPSQVIIGLAMFLTFLIMGPTFEEINRSAIVPLQEGEINEMQAWGRAKVPIRRFMFRQIDYADNWSEVHMILDYQGVKKSPDERDYADVNMLSLVPAFILSELKVAFLMGFKLYLPFLIIDMVIASVLISMGMLMLPPVLISLPFKLLMFVLVDGWNLVSGNMLASFAVPGITV